jgi:hypothetical protein
VLVRDAHRQLRWLAISAASTILPFRLDRGPA